LLDRRGFPLAFAGLPLTEYQSDKGIGGE
jgi:hypothetical protein